MDYLPCLCKIPIYKHFWTLNFYLLTDFQFFAAHFRTIGRLNHDKWLAHILASGARLSGLIPKAGEETFWFPNMLSLVSFAGMTLNKCAVLWIGTLTGGPVQGESPPVLVKESHIQTYSRTSVCGSTYLLRCRLQKRPHLLKKKKKSLPTLPNFFGVITLITHIFYLALLNMRNTLKKWLN